MAVHSVAVMGAGAVGCHYGVMLARTGLPVTLVTRPRHAEAIARNGGITVDEDGKVTLEPIRAVPDPSGVAGADLVILAVKCRDTEQACQLMKPWLAPGATVISAQNGIRNLARIRAILPNRSASAVVHVNASMPADGRVRFLGGYRCYLGSPAGGQAVPQDELEEIAGIFRRAGITSCADGTFLYRQWRKFLINCSNNAVGAVCDADYYTVASTPGGLDLYRALLEEGAAVARAETGLEIDIEPILADFAAVLKHPPTGDDRSSTAQDILAHRPTEIGELNGWMAELGRRHGIPVPLNEALATLVRIRENTWR